MQFVCFNLFQGYLYIFLSKNRYATSDTIVSKTFPIPNNNTIPICRRPYIVKGTLFVLNFQLTK